MFVLSKTVQVLEAELVVTWDCILWISLVAYEVDMMPSQESILH